MKLKILMFLQCIIVLFGFIQRLEAQVAANVIPRIGVVDLQRVYQAAKGIDNSAVELDQFREASNNEILARKQEIQTLKQESLTYFNNNDTEMYQDLENEIKKKEADLKRFHQNAAVEIRKIQKQAQSSANSARNQELVSDAVSTVARTRGYTVIFSVNTDGSSGLVYWTEKVDITNEVIAQLMRNF